MKILSIFPLLVSVATANVLAGSTIQQDVLTDSVSLEPFQDCDTTTTTSSTASWATFTLQQTTIVRSFIVVMTTSPTTPIAVKVWLGFDDADYIACGPAEITYDQTLKCGSTGMVTNVIKLDQPSNVSELWAFIWDIYDQSLPASITSITSTQALETQLNTLALTMDTQLWADSDNYFQSTHPAPDPNDPNPDPNPPPLDPDYWQVQYLSQIFVRSVILFAARGSSLQGVQVRVKPSSATDDASQICGSVTSATNFYLMGCLKTGDILKVEQTNGSTLSLYYVAPIYQDALCASQTDCAQVINKTYSVVTLPVTMGTPPKMSLSSVFSDTCCPVTWFLDSTNEVTGASISRLTQEMLVDPTTDHFHEKTLAALKFKLVYFDGALTAMSGVLTRNTSIACVSSTTFTIETNNTPPATTKMFAFTTDIAYIQPNSNYYECLYGTAAGSVTLECDQDVRPGYAVVQNSTKISMVFANRVSTAFIEQDYFVKCTFTIGSRYYRESYLFPSIDCASGLIVPQPTMTLDSQTIDVTSESPKKFTVQFGINKTITVNEFQFETIPTSVNFPAGTQCDALSYSVTCAAFADFVSPLSANMFSLDTSKVNPGSSSVILNMKLQITCLQFTAPIDYNFDVEVYECSAFTDNGQIAFNVYYMIDGTASTVSLPLINLGSNSLGFGFFNQSGAAQPMPSWLTFGSSPPTLTIQLADKNLQGKYKAEVTVKSSLPCTISFNLFLVAFDEPYEKYYFQYYRERLWYGLNPKYVNAASVTFTEFYLWRVTPDPQISSGVISPLTYTMSIDGATITQDENSSVTTNGLTWTYNATSGKYRLGLRFYLDKTDPNNVELSVGDHSLVLTVSSTHLIIDGSTATRIATQTFSLTLTVLDCANPAQFAPLNPRGSVIFDAKTRGQINQSVTYNINVKNPVTYLVSWGNSSCYCNLCCFPATYNQGAAYRSDATLISSINGGVNILRIHPSNGLIIFNQLTTKRSPLETENFIQPINFKVSASNYFGTTAEETLKFNLINCEQSPTLSQHNIVYFFDNSAAKTFNLVWQTPSTDLHPSCLANIFVGALNGTMYQDANFTSYLNEVFNYSPSFLILNEEARPPTITINPILQTFMQFIRDWSMKISTNIGIIQFSNPPQTSWCDEKPFKLGICSPLVPLSNNGVVEGQSTIVSKPGPRTILLQLGATPSGETGSICSSLVIDYSLANGQSWMSLTTGASYNTLTLDLTNVALGSYNFDYVITYSTQNASGTKFEMHTVTHNIEVRVALCSAGDWIFDSSWISLQANSIPVASASQVKDLSITLKAVFVSDNSATCGPTKYEQHIKISDGTNFAITSPCTDSFASCYGWEYHADGQQYITINLSKKTVPALEQTVTIVTTYYNGAISIAEGVTKEWPHLTIVDCSLATLITPDPKITMGSFSVGSLTSVLKSAVHEGDKTITVQSFSYNHSTCNLFTYTLTTTDTSLQSLIQKQSAQAFLFKASTKTVTTKLDIAMTLVVATPGVVDKSYDFTYSLYDCTSSTEVPATYYYAAMAGASSPLDLPVTLPYTENGAISYLDYCNTFVYEVKESSASAWSTPPGWMVLTNYNPISIVNGTNFKLKTSVEAHAGLYQVKKSLMVSGNQAVVHTVSICIYKPPTILFTGAGTTNKLQLLDINASGCVNFNAWEIIKKNSSCPSCAEATCDPATVAVTAYQFLRGGQTLTTSYSTNGTSGLMFADSSSQKQLCWQMKDENLVKGQTYAMIYQVSGILGSAYSGSYVQTFSHNFTIEVISCDSFTVVDPSTWLVNKSTNAAVPATGATIYFPASVYPTFEVQPYTNNVFCVNSGACCSMIFTSSLVQTLDASGTEVLGILSSNVALLSLDDTNLPTLLGSSAQTNLTAKLTMNTAHISFLRTFTIKFVNCAVASQANLSYLINRTTASTFTFGQANAACSGVIKVRNRDKSVLSKPWITINETSQSTLTINASQVQLADSELGDYPVSRYVDLVISGTDYNKLDFTISMCKVTWPTNNGVAASSALSFDKFYATGSVQLAAGSVTSHTACSGIQYSVTGLNAAWMTYDAATKQVNLDLTKSTASATFTYTLTYTDGVSPTFKVDFTITVTVIDCSIVMPTNWVSPKLSPTAFASIFTQDAQLSVTYTLQQVTSSMSPTCGTLTQTVTATISETSEDATSFLSQSSLDVTVSLSTRLETHATLTMNLSVVIRNNNYTQIKSFTIAFFDCRIPTGTINLLPNLQIEVGQLRSFTDQGYQNFDARCSNFQVFLVIEQTAGSWVTVTAAGNPAYITSYTNTQGTSPTLAFSIQTSIAVRGLQYQCKLILVNRENKQIKSGVFTLTFCKAEVTQAFISPSSATITGNEFSFVRAIRASDPKLQVVVSSEYYDPTQSQCSYTGLTIESLDTSLMTITSGIQQKTLSIDSFAWTSNGLVYSHVLELKVWHNSELVWFSDAPHTFTVKIYDCEKDMNAVMKWITESYPQTGVSVYLFEEGTGVKTLHITTPSRNYAVQCGPLVFEISMTDVLAIPNVALDTATGIITIQTPVDVFWGPADLGITIKNSYTSIASTVKLQVYDCKNAVILANESSQPSTTEMVSTSTSDWSYTWNAFTTSFQSCVVDTYDVTCSEGVHNIGSGLCSRGFQINTSKSNTMAAALNGKTISPLTIYAQYQNATQISVDHEGEFTFTISAYNQLTPNNKGSYSILVKITTPCNDASNWILPVKQTFAGSCRMADSKTFCDDIHYTVFNTQSNTIVAFTHRYPYSCKLSYQLKIKQAGVESNAPSFLQILDSSGVVTSTNPAILRIQTNMNSDVDYHKAELTLRATIVTKTGQTVLGAVQAQTQFMLFMFNDCTSTQVPMKNLGQTLAATFTVSQHLMSNPTYTNSISFLTVSPLKPSDQKYCGIPDSGLSLVQKDKPTSLLTPFNAQLFTLLPSQQTISGRISLHATNDDQVQSQTCWLANIGTTSCLIDFEIQVQGMNGTFPLAATGQVEFKTECYLALEYYDLINGAGADRWVWTQSDQTQFKKLYRIREPQVNLSLPRLATLNLPSIAAGSGKSIVDVCGNYVYSIESLKTNFTLVQPSLMTGPPLLQVYVDDPTYANLKSPPDFIQPYPLALQTTIPKTGAKILYATTPSRADAMTFQIFEPCFGLAYTKPQIFYNDGRNGAMLSFELKVEQPVLFDRFAVSFVNQEINAAHLHSCGRVTYEPAVIKDKGGVIQLGTLTDSDQNQSGCQSFTVYADSNDLKGTYNITFTAFITGGKAGYLYPLSRSMVQVTIEDCYVKTYYPVQLGLSTLNFNLNGRPQEVSFDDFRQEPACNYTQYFNLTVFRVQEGIEPRFDEGKQPDPNPIALNGRQRRVIVETSHAGLVNSTYQYWITGHLNNSPKFQAYQVYNWGPFKAKILESDILIDNSYPRLPKMLTDYKVFANETQTLQLGEVFDFEGNNVTLKDWSVTSSASSWIKLSDSVNIDKLEQLSFDVNPPDYTIGSKFQIQFTLEDNHPRSPLEIEYVVNLHVTEFGSQTQNIEWTPPNKLDPSYKQFLAERPLSGIPKKVSRSGSFVFEFSNPIDMVNLQDINQWNSENKGKEYFKFELIAGDEEFYNDNAEGYLYSWNITSATETTITFQFSFAQTQVISQRQTDSMRFKILKPEAFVSKTNGKQTDFTSSLQQVPRQVGSAQELNMIEEMTSTMNVFVKTLSASSAINILVSQSLQFLWGMINALQVIVFSVLFNIDIPFLTQEIEIMVLKMVSFDLFKTDSILQWVFNFDQEVTPPLNKKFEDANFETSNFLLNMGMMFLMEVLFMLLTVLLPLSRWLIAGKNARIESYLKSVNLFNNFVRFYLESQLDICICTLLTLRMMSKNVWSQPQLSFANVCAFGNVCLLVIMPIIVWYISNQFHKKYYTDWNYRAKYADIFEELRGNRKSSMLYFTFFTLRRYAIAVSLVAMPKNFLFQILLQVVSSCLFLVYLLDYKPHKCVKQGRIETFNELTVALSGYFLFLFTDLVRDTDRRNQAGYALIALIVSNLFVNVSIMMVDSFKEAMLKIKRLWLNYRLRQLQNQRLQALEEENRRVVEEVLQPAQPDLQPEQQLSPEQPETSFKLLHQQDVPEQNATNLPSLITTQPLWQMNLDEQQPVKPITIRSFVEANQEQHLKNQVDSNFQSIDRPPLLSKTEQQRFLKTEEPSRELQIVNNQRQSRQETDSIDDIFPYRYEQGKKFQDQGRTNTEQATPKIQRNSSMTTQQSSESRLVERQSQLVVNSVKQKQERSQSPYQVIQAYNREREAKMVMFKHKSSLNMSSQHRAIQPMPGTPKKFLVSNVINQRECFVYKRPRVTAEEQEEFKAAQEYLDRRFGGMD